MPDEPLLVALCAEYAREASITRPEVGKIVGKTLGQMAGIHHRNLKKIGTWPILSPERKKNRRCQFPLGTPETESFHLCGQTREGGDALRCKEHKGRIWKKPVDK